MTKRASQDLMEELHSVIAADLLKRIRSGEATAADLNVARAFLKDNGIEGVAVPRTPLADLAATLPFAGTSDDDDEQPRH